MNIRCVYEFTRRLCRRVLLLPAISLFVGIVLTFNFCFIGYLVVPILIICWIVFLVLSKRKYWKYYNHLSDMKNVGFTLTLSLVLSLVIPLTVYENKVLVQKISNSDIQETDFIEGSISKRILKLDGKKSFYIDTKDYGKVVLYDNNDKFNFYPGEKVHLSGKLEMPEKPRNPGEFDYNSYLEKEGVNFVFKADKQVDIKSGNLVEAVLSFMNELDLRIYKIRLFISQELMNNMNDDNGSMAVALFMGDKSYLSQEQLRDFKLTNSSHLLAVSGTHVSSMLCVLPFILDKLKFSKKKKILIFIVMCVSVGFMTGFGSSVSRAVFMAVGGLLLRDTISTMSLVAMILLVSNPYTALQVGFQMSFLMSIFIILYSKKIMDKLIKFGVDDNLSGIISALIVCQIASLLFMFTIDYRMSYFLLFIVVVLNAIVEILCLLFLPLLLLANLSIVFLWPLKFFIEVLLFLVRLGADNAFLSFRISDIFYPLLLVCALFFIIYRLPSSWVRPILMKLDLFFIAIFLGVGIAQFMLAPVGKVVFIDVGQGDSCLIITPNKTAIIDGGTEENFERLSNVLDYYNIESVDYGIMSHLDKDHAGGIKELFYGGRIKKLFTSCVDNQSKYKELGFGDDIIGNVEILEQIKAGDKISLSSHSMLDVFFPENVTEGDNDDSLIINLNYCGFNILYTGDIGFSGENILLNENKLSKCDVLKVSHHGSKTSTSDEFLNVVSPFYSVISVGEKNQYGHPNSDTIDRIENSGSKILRTDESGAIIMEIFSDRYEVCGYLSKN